VLTQYVTFTGRARRAEYWWDHGGAPAAPYSQQPSGHRGDTQPFPQPFPQPFSQPSPQLPTAPPSGPDTSGGPRPTA
jgi:hypothetical protein